MTGLFSENSHVYCVWFAPFEDGDNFFATMLKDEKGDRVIYRFEDSDGCNYFMIGRGNQTMRNFRHDFNKTVEEFCESANAPMEYIPVDGGVERALQIIEEQPWADQILPG